MLAFALRADGWYLRNDCIWAKGISFCDTYSGSCMPSSAMDRFTPGHEYVFLLSKSEHYYFDMEGVAEPSVTSPDKAPPTFGVAGGKAEAAYGDRVSGKQWQPTSTRHPRTVWAINPEPTKIKHYATMPTKLASICIKAGTSEYGACSICGAPYERVVEHTNSIIAYSQRTVDKRGAGLRTTPGGTQIAPAQNVTIGWQPTCSCVGDVVPCVVCDPFVGAGTSGVVALRLGRDFVGIDLNDEYLRMGRQRIIDDCPLFNMPAPAVDKR